MFRFAYCSCCGSRYILNSMSIYKFNIGGHVKRFCSYECYRKIQKLREEHRYDEIEKIIKSAEEHARYLKSVDSNN